MRHFKRGNGVESWSRYRLLACVIMGAAAAGLLAGCAGKRHVSSVAVPHAATPPLATAPPVEPANETLPPVSPPIEVAEESRPVADLPVRIRLLTGLNQLSMTASAPLQAGTGDALRPFPLGSYTLRPAGTTPAEQQFHLFVKTFPLEQAAQAAAYVEEWRQKGYNPRLIALGNRYGSTDGTQYDNRLQYVSLQHCATFAEAERVKTRLESQSQWSWIEPEIVRAGTGRVSLAGPNGKPFALDVPLALASTAPVEITATVGGKPVRGRYTGRLEVGIGADGLLELYETLPVEEYLKGVLPAEMPASWPAEALGAQALAARSEIYANWGVKHKLEGFQYCAAEHCRAYKGAGERHPATDAAVAKTAGMVLVDGLHVIPTVFSANCGGWTENNENVWSSPPNPALRGLSDFPRGASPAPRGPVALGMGPWLWRAMPAAYCGSDSNNFRWTRKFTASELSATVNKSYSVGAVRDIRPGERGVSGRLISVEIVGSQRTVTVRKELPIRQAFGGLPSAMFILDIKRGAKGPVELVFRGGGRGHGVGLCQQGARGMAAQGLRATDIVAHYFQGAHVTRLR